MGPSPAWFARRLVSWHCQPTASRPGSGGAVKRASGEDYWLASLSKERRRQLDRRRRRLAEALGGELEVVDRASDPQAIAEFIRLEASGWKGRQGTAFACVPRDALWFQELCSRFAGQGRLHVLALGVADRTVAIQCCLRSGPGMFLFMVADDDEFSRFGAGVLVQLEAARLFDASSAAWMDSSTDPGNDFELGLFPDRQHLATLLVSLRGPSAWGIVRATAARASGSFLICGTHAADSVS